MRVNGSTVRRFDGSMVRRVAGAAVLIVLACGAGAAQYGHPLKGTWSGDWGVTRDARTRLLLEFNWDGTAITGTINPGPNAVPVRVATLDPSNWTLHAEAEGKDTSGRAVRYVIDGKLENLGAYNRVLSGTWTQGGAKGDFRVVRN